MSQGEVAMTMTVVGLFGLLAVAMCYESRKVRWGGIAWFVFWAGPPLMQLWIRGVFG